MAGKSTYLEAGLLNHVFRSASLPQPAMIYVALYNSAPTDAGGGLEVSASGYARVPISRSDGAWTAPSGSPQTIANSGTVSFASATSNWGSVTSFGLFDSGSGGNLLYSNVLSSSQTISAGMTPSFAPGALTVYES